MMTVSSTKANLENAYCLNDSCIKKHATYRSLTPLFVVLLMILSSLSPAQNTITPQFQAIIVRVSNLIDNFQLKEAHGVCDSLIEVGNKTDNKNLLASVYNNKGTICREENDAKSAIECFLKAIEYNELLKNERRLAENYVNLGSIYNYIDERKIALSYYFKAINILKAKKDYNALSVLYNNIGNIYLDEKQLVSANYNLQKALQVSLLTNDSLNLARVYHNLGNCKLTMQELDSALYFYKTSLNYLSKFDVGFGHMYNYIQMASAHLQKNNTQEAETYLNKALITAKQANSYEDLASIYRLLAKTFRMKKNDAKAYDYLFLYMNFNDSLKDQNIKDELKRTKYESDLKNQKKEQEIIRANQEAINTARMDSKNKNLYLSYSALGFAVIMGLLILNGYRQKRKANHIISKQKEEVEIKNSEILASINYAKRIQYALLAHKDFMDQNLPESFVYFDPKDIVSGDFYWATKHGSKFYLAVCDSTGHGVPGAFMSLLNIGFLTEAINEKNIEDPGKVLDHVRTRLVESISKEGQKDGFDGILIAIDEQSKEIKYAAANNAPILISNGSIQELEKDSMPVGIGERKNSFSTRNIDVKKGDVLYLYTDGYADQFGGPKGKKFKYKQLNERLLELSKLDMETQRHELALGFKQWKGKLEQVDDVCVVGIKF